MFGQKSKLIKLYSDQAWRRTQIIEALYGFISDVEDERRPIEAYVPASLSAEAHFALRVAASVPSPPQAQTL